MTQNKNSYVMMDILKFILAMSVLVIHFQPLKDVSLFAHNLSGDALPRLAVPFFFMCTGYLVAKDFDDFGKVKRRLIKIAKLWLIWSLVYLPFRLIGMSFNNLALSEDLILLLKDVFFQGVFIHLWYLPAVIFSLLAIFGLRKFMSIKAIVLFGFVLFIVGSFGDAYLELLAEGSVLRTIFDHYLDFFITTRNGLFFGLFFVSLGAYFHTKPLHLQFKSKQLLIAFLLSLVLLFGELLVLISLSVPFDFNMRFGIIPSTVLLFMWAIRTPLLAGRDSTWFRLMSSMIYFSHFFVFYIYMAVVMIFNLHILSSHSLLRFSFALALTLWMSHRWILKARKKDGIQRKLLQLG